MNDNILISLGTNLGLKEKNLNQAMFLLEDFFRIKKKSNIYYSEPWGYSSKNTFLNMGVLGSTDLEPTELLHSLKKIESQMGREFSDQIEYQDRIIDLDILLYNSINFNSKDLIIPHNKITERKFAIIILKDIFQNEKIPVFNKTADSILEKTLDKSELILFKKNC